MLLDVTKATVCLMQIPSGTENNMAELPKEAPYERKTEGGESDVTEEQKARMEANRLKALEKAAARARARASQVS